MTITIDVIRAALASDAAFGNEEDAESIAIQLIEVVTKLGLMNEPVTPEGICLIHAELIEYTIKAYGDSDLVDTLRDGVRQLRDFVIYRTELIGDMTDEEILTAEESPLNGAAMELLMQGILDYKALLQACPSALVPKTN